MLAGAENLLSAIDPAPGALWAFRTIDSRADDIRLATMLYGTLDRSVRQSRNPEKNGKPCRAVSYLRHMQGLGADVFYVVNETDGQGQSDRNVTRIRAFIADADSREQVERVHAFITASGLTPTAVVASGGLDGDTEKQQVLWRVSECPVSAYSEAQRTLISRCGTDPSIINPSRVFRLPGFYHQKRTPRLTRTIALNPGAQYEAADFLARVRAQPQVCDPWARSDGSARSPRAGQRTGAAVETSGPKARLRALLDRYGGLTTPAVRALLREAMVPTDTQSGNRHATLATAVGRCVQAGWPDSDIQGLVLPVINADWADGDWQEHLSRIIGWTREQEAAAIAAMPMTAPHVAAAFGAGAV